MGPDHMIPNSGLRLVKSDRDPNVNVKVDITKLLQDRLEKHLASALQHALGESVLVYPDQYPTAQRAKVAVAAKLAVNAFTPAGLMDASLRAREALSLISYQKDYSVLNWGQRQSVDVAVNTVWDAVFSSLCGVSERLTEDRMREFLKEPE